jgi:chromatin assembly factor 1 subunit B
VTFSEGELGTPYQPAQCEETEESPGLPSSFKTLLQGEIFEENVQPADGNNTSGISEDFHLAYEDTVMSLDSPNQKNPVSQTNAALLSPKNVRSPRRVQLITLSSPKQAKN